MPVNRAVKFFLPILLLVALFSSTFVPQTKAQGIIDDAKTVGGAVADEVKGAAEGVLSEIGEALKSVALDVASLIIGLITFLFGYLASLVVSLGGGLLGTAMDLNRGVLQDKLVLGGFSVTLSFANLGFVLAIIVIAFVTILRMQNYNTKELLSKLIIAALLVNFSLTIAGLLIDFTGILTDSFIKPFTDRQNYEEFATKFVSGFKPSDIEGTINNVRAAGSASASSFGTALVNIIAQGAFNSLGTVLLAIVLLGTSVMIYIRYLFLAFLLILMPLAWLFWIFPSMSGLTSKWWNTFTKWLFFLPATTFFLSLTYSVSTLVNIKTTGAFEGAPGALPGILKSFGELILKLGLLTGGLYVAQEMGIKGASTFMNAANAVKGWAIGAIGKTAKLPLRGAKAGAEYLGTRPAKALATGVGNLLQSRALRWIPGAMTASANLRQLGSRKEEVDEYQKKYLNSLSEEQLKSLQANPPAGPVAKASVLAELAKRGMIDSLTKEIPANATPAQKAKIDEENAQVLKSYISAAQSVNPGIAVGEIPTIKEILAVNPKLAEKLIGQPVEEATRKIRADKAADISKDSLSDERVVLNLNQPQISSIYRSGSAGQIDALIGTLEKMLGPTLKGISDSIIKTQADLGEAKAAGDQAQVAKLQGELQKWITSRKNALPGATKEQQAAYQKLQLTYQRVGNP